MQFIETAIEGVYIIEPEPIQDERGFFARFFCRREFSEHGLDTGLMQGNISFNKVAGTLRGLHYQNAPAAEAKLVRCTKGSIVDVAVDIRPDSPTQYQHVMVELTADNHRALYIPKHFAHGFQTLETDTEVNYLVSANYSPEHEGGLHHADPRLGIEWPHAITIVSDRDQQRSFVKE